MKQMKMGARLAASFLILAAAIIGLAAYTYYAVQVTDSYVNNLYETDNTTKNKDIKKFLNKPRVIMV